jgi:hypothetical protein
MLAGCSVEMFCIFGGISGSRGGEYEDDDLLEYYAV